MRACFHPEIHPITNVTGDYLHENTATLLMEIGGLNPGTGHDQLSIDGTLEIEGDSANCSMG